MTCTSIKKNTNKVCVGDLDKRINIYYRSIIGSSSPNTNAGVGYALIASAWALIKTSANNKFIDGVNIQGSINTDFYIRYSSIIDFERQLWIGYGNNYYEVDSVNNIDKDNKFVRLRSIEKGDSNINANKI